MHKNITDQLIFKYILEFFLEALFYVYKDKTNSPNFYRYHSLEWYQEIKGGQESNEILVLLNKQLSEYIGEQIMFGEDLFSLLQKNHFKRSLQILNFIKENNVYLSGFQIYPYEYILFFFTFFYDDGNRKLLDNRLSIVEDLYKNINNIDTDFLFFVYWSFFHLVPSQKINLLDFHTYIKKALQMDENNPYFLIDYSRVLGIHVYNKKREKKYLLLALKAILQGLKGINKSDHMGYMMSWIGSIYRHLGEYEKSLQYINAGIERNKSENVFYSLPYIWKLSVFILKGEYSTALQEGEKYLDLLSPDQYDYFRLYKTIGIAYLKKNNLDKTRDNICFAFDKMFQFGAIKIQNGSYIEVIQKDSYETCDLLIQHVADLYKKMIQEGGVHCIDFCYLDKLCFDYVQQKMSMKNV